jgi:hypothetical protein
MDVNQSVSSMASLIITPASSPPTDTGIPVTPPPAVTEPEGGANTEGEGHAGDDTSVPEREEDLGVGTKGAET